MYDRENLDYHTRVTTGVSYERLLDPCPSVGTPTSNSYLKRTNFVIGLLDI